MSLCIYTSIQDVPSNLGRIVNYNDLYFDGQLLRDTLLVRQLLSEIDRAEYVSPTMILGRDKSLGRLNKSCLSTGCKTLLNVVLSPSKCFDLIECGVNVLQLLPLVTCGHVLWREPSLPRMIIQDCDINYQGLVYHDFLDFLEKVEEEQNADNS